MLLQLTQKGDNKHKLIDLPVPSIFTNGTKHAPDHQKPSCWYDYDIQQIKSQNTGGRLNKKDGLTRYGNSHVKDKTS